MRQITLRSTADFSAANGCKIVVYGRAGMGKTRLCATMPNPVIFSAESGLMSLAQYALPYHPIYSLQDLKDVYQWARSSTEARQFESICLDSISDIAEGMLATFKQTVVANSGKPDHLRAYGTYNDECIKVIKEFRDLVGKHVYMSAKQDRITRPDGITLNGPSLPGKQMHRDFPHIPDFLFQADHDAGGNYYFLRTKADYGNDAKDRSGLLEERCEPHLGKIIDRILRRQPGAA